MSSQRYQEFIAERTRLLERIKELEAENAELRKRLGEPSAQQFYRDAGIHLLRDSAVTVGDLCIIGRDDRTNLHRKSLGKIVNENKSLISNSSFLILLDHQPYHLEQAEQQHLFHSRFIIQQRTHLAEQFCT